jgi:hypothetical protein
MVQMINAMKLFLKKKRPPTEAALFRLVADPGHKTRAAPKLDVLVFHQAPGFLDCLRIIGAS